MTERSLRLLVSDDSAYVRRHLVAMLAAVPEIEVVGETGSVEATMEAVHRLSPDVLVLDIQMPDGNGIDVLAFVKSHTPDTTVIMLTNHANTFYRRVCMKAGADYFFDKSTEFEQVVGVLETIRNDAV